MHFNVIYNLQVCSAALKSAVAPLQGCSATLKSGHVSVQSALQR